MWEKIKSMAGSYGFDGIILLLVGLFMILWPQASLKILCIIVGIILIVLGIIKIAAYAGGKQYKKDGKPVSLPVGIIQTILGILLFVISRFFITVFLIVAGLVLLYGCFLMFRKAYAHRAYRDKEFYFNLIAAVLILVLGIVMIFNPAGTASFIIQMIGVAAVIEGLVLLLSFRNSDK